MFCMHCGKQNDDGSTFCAYCGKLIGEPVERGAGLTSHSVQSNRNQTILAAALGSIVDFLLGTVAIIWSLITYSNDTSKFFGGYNYKSPLTGHELMVIVIGGCGILCIIIGLVTLVIRISKHNQTISNYSD